MGSHTDIALMPNVADGCLVSASCFDCPLDDCKPVFGRTRAYQELEPGLIGVSPSQDLAPGMITLPDACRKYGIKKRTGQGWVRFGWLQTYGRGYSENRRPAAVVLEQDFAYLVKHPMGKRKSRQVD